MAMDLPNSPAVNDQFTVGLTTYRWDGEKWTSGVAPVAGKKPIYDDGSVPMVAQLTLIDPPVNPTDAADKNYVDNLDMGTF
jgi:hypothetical protein